RSSSPTLSIRARIRSGIRSRSTLLSGTPVLLSVHVREVGVCVGMVVDVECHVALRADLEVGAVALVADTDDEFVESGVPVERHVDAAGAGATGHLSAFGFGGGRRAAPTPLREGVECAAGGIGAPC